MNKSHHHPIIHMMWLIAWKVIEHEKISINNTCYIYVEKNNKKCTMHVKDIKYINKAFLNKINNFHKIISMTILVYPHSFSPWQNIFLTGNMSPRNWHLNDIVYDIPWILLLNQVSCFENYKTNTYILGWCHYIYFLLYWRLWRPLIKSLSVNFLIVEILGGEII